MTEFSKALVERVEQVVQLAYSRGYLDRPGDRGWSDNRDDLMARLRDALTASGLDEAIEALNGYRAAVSYISADAWDGCGDCMEILRDARTLDVDWDWAHDPNRIAAELKRVRSGCARTLTDKLKG